MLPWLPEASIQGPLPWQAWLAFKVRALLHIQGDATRHDNLSYHHQCDQVWRLKVA